MIVVHTLLMACRQFGDRAVRHFIKMKGNEMKKFIVGIALACIMCSLIAAMQSIPWSEWASWGYPANMPPFLHPDYNN